MHRIDRIRRIAWQGLSATIALCVFGFSGSNSSVFSHRLSAQTLGSSVPFDTVIHLKGTLKGVRGNLLTITKADGSEVAVKLNEDPTKLVFSAEALRTWVRPGIFARVNVAIGPNGKPSAPIEQVELFRAFAATKLSGQQKQRYSPGIHASDRSAPKPNPNAANTYPPGKYTIVGQVVGVDGSGVMLNTGKARIPLPTTPDAKFLIRYHDLTLAQPGDPVSLDGFHQPPDESKVIASVVRVTTDRIYGQAVENDTRRGRTSTRRNADPEPEAPQSEDPAS